MKEKTIRNTAMITGAISGGSAAIGGVLVGGVTGTAGAAALTSGLAAVGAVIGGGMLSGMVVIAAAPIAGAAAALGIFKLYKKLSINSRKRSNHDQTRTR